MEGRAAFGAGCRRRYLINRIWDLFHSWDAHKSVWKASPESLYGRRKTTALLRATSPAPVAACTVARCLKIMSHQGVRRLKRVRTTVADPNGRRAGDLLDRDFTAPAPHRVWVTDYTYVRTWSGFVYVVFIIDVFSRRIVAWHASTSKSTELVMTPLRMAMWERRREGHPVMAGELIHHSDAGSQYTSIRLTDHLETADIAASIGSVGDAYDNALMESGNGLYKTECIRTTIFHQGPYKTLSDVEFATAAWVEWYNHRRLHSSVGNLSPVQAEQAHYAALNLEAQPT